MRQNLQGVARPRSSETASYVRAACTYEETLFEVPPPLHTVAEPKVGNTKILDTLTCKPRRGSGLDWPPLASYVRAACTYEETLFGVQPPFCFHVKCLGF